LRAVQAGQLLSPELTAAFFTPQAHWHSSDQWQTYFGYGLKFYVDPTGQLVYYQKEGVNTGVSGVIRYFPQEDYQYRHSLEYGGCRVETPLDDS
jgi:hypothetical protein